MINDDDILLADILRRILRRDGTTVEINNSHNQWLRVNKLVIALTHGELEAIIADRPVLDTRIESEIESNEREIHE
jgi:hypothetical protein